MAYASVFVPGLFTGKVVIVTGGGSGIGRCVAHELAALGASVALVGRKIEKLQKVVDEINQDGGQASVYVCDIRQEEAVRQTITDIKSHHGQIDGLVNNAGGQYMTPLESISAKGWEAVINTNLTGGFLMARECYTQAMAKSGGAIVNIVADMWGSMPGMGHSGAARAGMVSFTETAAAEWAGSGVRVNAVAPGYVRTPMIRRLTDDPALEAATAQKVPLGRFAEPEEIGWVIAFLAGEGASMVTGQILPVDGGLLA